MASWSGGGGVVGSKRKRGDDDTAGDGGAHTIYLEGLPYTSTEDDIRKFLDGCGTITDVRAPRFQDSGRLMGYAHVDFDSEAALAAALERDGQYLGGRFINVSRAKPLAGGADTSMAFSTTARPKNCTTVFVKNLPYDCTDDTVRTAMSAYGAVLSVRLGRWNHTHQLKGFGYVQFTHGTSAEKVVNEYRASVRDGGVSSVKVGGRPVHVDWETGAPRGSFKTETGRAFFRTDEGKKVSHTLPRPAPATAAAAATAAAGSTAANLGKGSGGGGGGGGGAGGSKISAVAGSRPPRPSLVSEVAALAPREDDGDEARASEVAGVGKKKRKERKNRGEAVAAVLHTGVGGTGRAIASGGGDADVDADADDAAAATGDGGADKRRRVRVRPDRKRRRVDGGEGDEAGDEE